VSSESRETQSAEKRPSENISAATRERMRFFAFAQIYTGLLVFVVVAGIPVIGVPALRHRLAVACRCCGPPCRRICQNGCAQNGRNEMPFPPNTTHRGEANYRSSRVHECLPSGSQSIQGECMKPGTPKNGKSGCAQRRMPGANQPQPQTQQARRHRAGRGTLGDAEPVYRQGRMSRKCTMSAEIGFESRKPHQGTTFVHFSLDVASRAMTCTGCASFSSQLPAKRQWSVFGRFQLMSSRGCPPSLQREVLPKSERNHSPQGKATQET